MAGHWRRWWANVPDYLDPSTDDEKLRWLDANAGVAVRVRVLPSKAEALLWFCGVGRTGEGRTLSEALCRLILAVKEAGRDH